MSPLAKIGCVLRTQKKLNRAIVSLFICCTVLRVPFAILYYTPVSLITISTSLPLITLFRIQKRSQSIQLEVSCPKKGLVKYYQPVY